MEDKRCSKCGSTEDAEVIQLFQVCVACGEPSAIDTLIYELRVSYGWRDGNLPR